MIESFIMTQKCITYYVLSFAGAPLSALLACWINYLHRRYLTKQYVFRLPCQMSVSVQR